MLIWWRKREQNESWYAHCKNILWVPKVVHGCVPVHFHSSHFVSGLHLFWYNVTVLDVKRSPDIIWLIRATVWILSGILLVSWMRYWLADRKPCSDNKGRNYSAITGKPPLISHLLVHLFPCQWSCLHMRAKSLIVQYLILLFCSSFFLFILKCRIFHRQYQNQNKTAARVMEC